MLNKNSQWIIFFCAILYNKYLKKKKKKKNVKYFQYAMFAFIVSFVSTNEVRNHFYLHFWFNKTFIKLLMHCVHVFRKIKKKKKKKKKKNLYSVEFRWWGVMSSSITLYFLSELHNNKKLCNAFENDSSRSYWGRKKEHFYNELVDLLLLSIIVIFHLFSIIRRVISNNTIVLTEIRSYLYR